MKINKGAGCIGYYKNKLLFVKNLKEDIIVPKGHIEEGETSQEAAIREFTEETGYKDFKLHSQLEEKLVYTRGEGKEKEQFIIYIYLAVLSSLEKSQKRTEDGKKLKNIWVNMTDAENTISHKNVIPIIQKIQKTLAQ